jgi:translocation and assembly module TamB
VNGEVRIGRVEGNLLRGVRLVDVSIVDTEGRPFVEADTIETRFSLRSLVRRRLALTDLRLIGARVVLDKPPGEDWNWVRIFAREPPVAEERRPGWGAWIRLHDVELVNSDVLVRTAWSPPEDLTAAERDSTVAKVLAGRTRENVVEVDGGYQNLLRISSVNAEFPLIIPAHPDSVAIPIEVARLSARIEPFLPPAAIVNDLSGSFRLGTDSLFFRDVRAVLPGSRLSGDGVYALDSGDLLLRTRGAPLAFDDFRWLYPDLPEEGGGSLQLTVHRRSISTRLVGRGMDLRVRDATIAGDLDIRLGDTLRVRESDLTFARVPTDLLERVVPAFESPRSGLLGGELRLSGTPDAMDLDGDVTFDDAVAGRSRVVAVGRLQLEPDLRFEDMRLRFEPIQAELVRAVLPQIPVRGTVAGYANLTGEAGGLLRLDSDLTLVDPASGRSRVRADGGVDMRGDLRLDGLRLTFEPLRLDALRGEVPELPAGGTLAGSIRLDGVVSRELSVDGAVSLTDPATGSSTVAAVGAVSYADGLRFRNMRMRFEPLRLDLLRGWLPDLPAGASVSGPLRIDGEPETRLALDGDLTLSDPATGTSRIAGTGAIELAGETVLRDLRLRFSPLQLDLARRWLPDLPAGATVEGPLRLDGSPGGRLAVNGDLRIQDPASGSSRLAVDGGIAFAGGLRFHGFEMEAGPVQLGLLRAALPDLPSDGTVAGRLRLDGTPTGDLRLDANLTHDGGGAEVSRVIASGGVNLADGPRFSALRVEMRPLRADLLRGVIPDLPLGGTLSGVATLDGSAARRLDVRGDVEHTEADQRSRVNGHVTYVPGGAGWASVDVNLLPLSLEVAGRFVPEAGLRGVVSGSVLARGNLSDLALTADLDVRDGGAVRATGVLDLAGDSPVYDVTADFRDFDAAAVTSRAPSTTALTGPLTARGRGLDPATLRMELSADLADSRIAGLEADAVRLRLAIAEGLLTSDSSVIRVGSTLALAHGSFGLTENRTGELRYRIETDSLRAFARLGREAETSIRTRRLPIGRPEPRDTAGDPLAGALAAEGVLRGNVTRFDATGRAEVEDLVVAGNAIGRGRATYSLQGIGSEQAVMDASAELFDVRAQGMSFDSLSAELEYAGGRFGTGHAIVDAHADEATDLRADARFQLALDRRELQLGELAVRVDTVFWRTARPATIAWGGAGVEIAGLDLQSSGGGRVGVDGRLPLDGAADLEVEIADLEIGHLIALLQLDEESGGRLDLNARVQGTTAAPVISGSGRLLDGFVDGLPLPDTRATFSYIDRELAVDAEMWEDGRMLAEAEAELPIDLALAGRTGPLLLDGPIAVDLRADSLPVDAIPGFTDQLAEISGRVTGDLSLRGTFDSPTAQGTVGLDLETLRIVPVGVTFEEVAGSLEFQGDALVVESLTARSGGPIEVSGRLGLADLRAPTFDLAVITEDALVYDTDRARLRVDAQVEVRGPFDGIEVTGDVQTRSGVIYIPELADFGGGQVVNLDDPVVLARADTILRAERDALIRRSPFLQRLQVDLAFTVDRDVWLRSREANVEIYTPAEVGPLHLRLDGGSGDFVLEGTINTDRGEYEFMSRRFVLTRGAAIFTGTPDFNPFLQIAAEHEVRLPAREAFSIRVVLDGELRSLAINIESTSQPPIPQSDLLSYLAFGRDASSLLLQQGSALSGEGGLSGGLVGNVAGLATQQLASVALEALVEDLERDAMQAARLDVFRITPADVPAEIFTGSYLDVLRGTELEAGRYVNSRLFVGGQIRAASMVPGVTVEYRTPRGFRWVTSWSPRFVPSEPTLADSEPATQRVFGTFLFREWRF